jgi:hypothetical protein
MPFPKLVRKYAWLRSKHRCECPRAECRHGERCNKKIDDMAVAEFRYRMEKSKGGLDNAMNCEVLCAECYAASNTVVHGATAPA